MLVVTAIIMILTTVLLVSNNSYGGTVILKSLAYDVALSLREAQTYGISVRQSGAGSYSSGYGVEVRAASPSDYLLYVDNDSNGYYTDMTELVTRYKLNSGYTIADICYTPAGSTSETCGATILDITFVRPEPDAFIRVNNQSAVNQNARIKLTSPNGAIVSVLIEATGQISVQ